MFALKNNWYISLYLFYYFRCSKDTCDECLETFGGYKFIPIYDCDGKCANTQIQIISTLCPICKYCDNFDDCSSLCKQAKQLKRRK